MWYYIIIMIYSTAQICANTLAIFTQHDTLFNLQHTSMRVHKISMTSLETLVKGTRVWETCAWYVRCISMCACQVCTYMPNLVQVHLMCIRIYKLYKHSTKGKCHYRISHTKAYKVYLGSTFIEIIGYNYFSVSVCV